MAWQSKVFKNRSHFTENTLYLATLIDGKDTEEDKVKFSYKVKDAKGFIVDVNRSIPNTSYSLIRWLENHTAFDEDDADMTELKASEHLVLIGYYNRNAFIQRVFPLGEEWLQND